MIDKLKLALDPSQAYHNMALDIDGYGQPIDIKDGVHYTEHPDFLNQTTAAMIAYTLDGEESEMSLAMAIDLFQPCNWNFLGNLVIILKAIDGNLHPDKPFAPCSLNARLNPLRNRLSIISNTLKAFCQGREETKDVDSDILAFLGTKTDQKLWLAASLGKTIKVTSGF